MYIYATHGAKLDATLFVRVQAQQADIAEQHIRINKERERERLHACWCLYSYNAAARELSRELCSCII